MDTKRLIMGSLLIMVLVLGYQYFLVYEYAKHPEWKRPNEQTASTPATLPTTQTAEVEPETQPATQSDLQIAATTQPSSLPIVIGSEQFKDDKYRLGLSVVPTGAALDNVVLNEFRQEVQSAELFTFQTPYPQNPDQTRSLATTAVIVDGDRLEVWDKPWNIAEQTDHSITFTLDIAKAGVPMVRVTKQYVVEPAQADPSTPRGYQVVVNYGLRNLTKLKQVVSLEFNGPTVPIAETSRQQTEIVAGYDEQETLKLDHQTLSTFSQSKPSVDFVQKENLPLLWLGASSTYFNAIVQPQAPLTFSKAVATAVNPESSAFERLVAIRFTSQNVDLPAAAHTDLSLQVFLGPKARSLLDSGYYSEFPREYGKTVILSSGICGLCTIPWLINILVAILAALHVVLRDWGLSIIALVCIVRVLLHPITKRSQVSMMKMQKLGPEIERLKKKFGDDKDGFSKAQMEMYKSVGFVPILGCLPMFLQSPIFIALWMALQTTFELRQAPFHFTWIHDLAEPDALVKFAHPIPLPFGWTLASINILPVAMAVVTYINQKYFMPRPAATTPEQQQQQKMMLLMSPLFPILLYTLPSGLNLYYLTSTSLGILESKRIRDHIRRVEAQQAATGPVIVKAGKLSPAKSIPTPKKKGWLAKLQEQAEQLARESEKRKRKRS